ncbi:MAG TPA: FtsL-like putative cell division protein [Bacteroidales bacterium]|nr:FtsL-like putative cell division protein [Bacteroidales bacterium]HPL05143.1 FtsL-like putative cell division protein [Bacteroidales bacterium]HPX75803.1 FtsL-like putative cell division protein [Bacteroidales bacterium]HQB22053.1 FtsL-like putative cell division protein [Bacteroidales bacterium]
MKKENTSHIKQIKTTIKGLFNGSILVSDFVRRQIPFIVFLFILGLIYISNRFNAENIFRQTDEAKKRIENLRSEKIEIQSPLMQNSRKERVLELLNEKGSQLKEPSKPPYKISSNKDK